MYTFNEPRMNVLPFSFQTEDFPEPKLAQSKPKALTDDLTVAVRLAGISIFNLDLKTCKIRFTEQNENICCIPLNQFIHIRTALNLVQLQHRNNLVKAFKAAYCKQATLHQEFEVNTPGSESKWLQLTARFDNECERESGRFICLLTDITERKQNEIRRNELISMLNHDLRTPLTTIKLYIQMFAKLAIQSDQINASELLGIAGNQVDCMTKMIENFLTSSVLETGKIKINYSYFELSAHIRQLVATDYGQSGRQILINCPDQVYLNADRDKITQVLHNYISNALKYSPDNSRIMIRVRKAGSLVITSVTDHGLGIEVAEQEKLFSKFFRSESEAVQKIKGFGIGLFLVKDIIEEHKGKVWATSDPGKGSTFSFSIPTAV
jgi:signal transduction histidine kinase